MKTIDYAIAELMFVKKFAQYKRDIEKYTDMLNDFIALNFDEHYWQGNLLAILFAKTYTTVFNTIPRIYKRDGDKMDIVIDEISIEPAIAFHLSFYKPLADSIQFHVRNLPLESSSFLNAISSTTFVHQYIAFDHGVLTNFFYYYLPLPFSIRALTIFCARAKRTLMLMKKIHSICALPSPHTSIEELFKYWERVKTIITLLKGGNDDD